MSFLILASASPQRKELLIGLGVEFEVIVPPIEESDCQESDPVARNKILARLKAESVAKDHPDSFVIGSDTLVVSAGGELLEKAGDADGAKEMIGKLSGRTCVVHSAVCVIAPDGSVQEGISSSSVTFKKLTTGEIDWWISTELWKGRSGSFQIDGKGQMMIEKIEGDWTGVVGLPVFLLTELLQKSGYNIHE